MKRRNSTKRGFSELEEQAPLRTIDHGAPKTTFNCNEEELFTALHMSCKLPSSVDDISRAMSRTKLHMSCKSPSSVDDITRAMSRSRLGSASSSMSLKKKLKTSECNDGYNPFASRSFRGSSPDENEAQGVYQHDENAKSMMIEVGHRSSALLQAKLSQAYGGLADADVDSSVKLVGGCTDNRN